MDGIQLIEQDAIETAGGMVRLLPCQIMLCGQDDAAAFGGGDAGGGAAKTAIAPQPDFNEDQRLALLADQIKLAAPHPEIARQQLQALPLQEIGGQIFGLLPYCQCAIRAIFGPILIDHSPPRALNLQNMNATTLPCALYVVATPLGNLADITLRGRDILLRVHWVAAEDTRHSAPLLKHLGSKARLFAAHQHNEEAAAARILKYLAAGEAVALIADAGTPCISDPGARIVARVRAAGYPVIPLPGACALTTALSAAGIESTPFLFYGFLPAKSGERRSVLSSLAALPYTLIFYEAPHRLMATISACVEVLGGKRTLVLARELSKLFEHFHRAPLEEINAWLRANPMQQKGEFVLMIEAPPPVDADAEASERLLGILLAEGLPVKQCARLAAQIGAGSKNALYAQALAMKKALPD